MDRNAKQILGSNPRKLFLISFCALFLEMAAIRWLNTTAPVLSYFNNLILISCFFGLGVGCLLARRNFKLIHLFSIIFVLFCLAVFILKNFSIDLIYKGDYLLAPHPVGSQNILNVPVSAIFGFFINMMFFVVIGQELGRQLNNVGNPLRAYSYDISGSLAGTLVYMIFSWAGTPPHIWFLIGCLLLTLFLPKNRKLVVISITLVICGIYLISSTYRDSRWSPYYKVTVAEYKDQDNRKYGFTILVDNARIQDAIDFSSGIEKTNLGTWIPYYRLPHQLIKAQKSLFLGAGSGNEAVMALLQNIPEISAVEIDPVITDLGRELHPQRPYDHPRVKVFVEDARSFISSSKEKYDLIVMSALDSHKQLPGLSSLRLESFMYTVEAFRQIRELLAPGGIFCLNLTSFRKWISPRVYWTLTEAFGKEPLVLRSDAGPYGSNLYVSGSQAVLPSIDTLRDQGIAVLPTFGKRDGHRLSTDDWPFLYLEKNRIPPFNVFVMAFIIMISVYVVFRVEPASKKVNFHYFFLGAGFMLLETRSITQLALVFGMTWHVTGIVISVILLAIFIANYLVMKNYGIASKFAYPLLFATLLIAYFFPFSRILGLNFIWRLCISAIIVGLPIIWAAFIFSNSFRKETKVNAVFGSNLLGVVVGGALEYVCNIWGLNFLLLVAISLYLASALILLFRKTKPAIS
jgi:SAM-dependent methyltransferase